MTTRNPVPAPPDPQVIPPPEKTPMDTLAAELSRYGLWLPREGNIPFVRIFIDTVTLNNSTQNRRLDAGKVPEWWRLFFRFQPLDPATNQWMEVVQPGQTAFKIPVWTGVTGDAITPPFTLPGTGRYIDLNWTFDTDPFTVSYFVYAGAGFPPSEMI